MMCCSAFLAVLGFNPPIKFLLLQIIAVLYSSTVPGFTPHQISAVADYFGLATMFARGFYPCKIYAVADDVLAAFLAVLGFTLHQFLLLQILFVLR